MFKKSALALATLLAATSLPAHAAPTDADISALAARLERLEADNTRLRAQVEELQAARQGASQAAQSQAAPVQMASATQPQPVPATAAMASQSAQPALIGFNPTYSAAVLGHTENVNQRRIIQLEQRQAGKLNQTLTVSGEVIAIGDAHWSNRANKFGYLMRHPTGSNERTKATQEVSINSAQLGFTIAPTPDFTGYLEMLYDPEQSFGAGTITALARNQIQLRKAYVMWGNLDRSPIYVAAGKMDVPFGLQDSVSPFSNSSNWHAFAPLAFGGELGYYNKGLSIRAMAVEGGAQFRAANTSVDGTAVPSKLNNFALDASYKLAFADNGSLMLGGSYLHGSAYCQDYPIGHFAGCSVSNVPAWAAYGRLKIANLEVIGDYASTTKIWPGTKVPNPANPLSVFPASKVSSYTFGARYTLGTEQTNTRLSLEYSKFIAGPAGSPWHRQDQTVAGISHQFVPGVSLFGEFINIRGYEPLNFLTGGNFPDGSTWSDASARSQVVMTGARLGF